MLYARAGIGTRHLREYLLVAVEEQVYGGVADGVGAELPTGGVGAGERVAHYLRVLHPEAAVVCVVQVRLAHAGGMAADGAVQEDLGRADFHPLIAEAGAYPGGSEVLQRMVGEHH